MGVDYNSGLETDKIRSAVGISMIILVQSGFEFFFNHPCQNKVQILLSHLDLIEQLFNENIFKLLILIFIFISSLICSWAKDYFFKSWKNT